MNSNVIKIIVAIVVVINVILVAITSISVGSAVKRQLSAESETTATVSDEISSLTLVKEIFSSKNFVSNIKTIEGINLIIFGVLIFVKAKKY